MGPIKEGVFALLAGKGKVGYLIKQKAHGLKAITDKVIHIPYGILGRKL